MSKIEELEKQIKLIEMNAGIQPNKNRLKNITSILVRIHDLKKQLSNTKSSDPNFNAIKDSITHSFGELIEIQPHPQEIIQYFSKNRWLQFEEKPLVFLDSYSGLLWPRKTSEFPYTKLNIEEKNNALFEFHLDGFTNWRLPSQGAIKFLLSQKNFPYYTVQSKTICEHPYIWIAGGDHPNYGCNIRNNYSIQSIVNALFLPYCSDLTFKSYVAKQNKNKIFVLQLILTHNLKVVIDDKVVAKLYKEHYELLYDLLLQLHALNNPKFTYVPQLLDESEPNNLAIQNLLVQNIKSFSYKSDFNEAKLNTSVLSYYPAASELLNEFITFIAATEAEQKDLINFISDVLAKFKDPLEFNFIKPIHNEIRSFMQIIRESPISELHAMNNDLVDQVAAIDGKQTLASLAQFEKLPRPSFTLLKEYGEQITNEYIDMLNLFSKQKEAINGVNLWYDELLNRINQIDYSTFTIKWEQEFIDVETHQRWIEELKEQVSDIHTLYVPFVKDTLYGQVSFETFQQVDVALKEQFEEVTQFYLNQRSAIHQKYAFQVGGEMQEKLEVQTFMYNLSGILLKNIVEVASGVKNESERNALLTNIQAVFTMPIDRINSLVGEISIIKDIIDEFHQLKQQQLTVFAEDVESFIEAQQQRHAQYNSLMYKMRKQLMKQHV